MTRYFSIMILLQSLSARAELVDRVAAVVDQEVVTLSDVMARADMELRKLPPNTRSEDRRELIKRALRELTDEALMDAQVRELGIEVPATELDATIAEVKRQNKGMSDEDFDRELATQGFTLAGYRRYLAKFIARNKVINLKVRPRVKIADEDVKTAYAKEAHDASLDIEIRARHILILVPPNAAKEQVDTAYRRALAIAHEAKQVNDFAELAKRKSEGPSAADGGDLGYFRQGTMTAEFDRAAFALAIGETSVPVRTRFGWHIIRVEDRRSVSPPAFDDLRDAIRERLAKEQIERLTREFLTELRTTHSVEEML